MSGSIGTAVFTVTNGNSHLHVSSAGMITTVGKSADGIFTLSGADADSSNDTGTGTCALTVGCTHSGTTSIHFYSQDSNPVVVGGSSVYVAIVRATSGIGPLTGTISFDENRTAVPGCVAIHPLLSLAYCKVSFPGAGLVTVSAVYGNDPNFGGPTDSSVQKVTEGTT